jgi:antirestriction protein ArdC
MKKKTLNPEQQAAKLARRERFKALVKQVAAMTDEQRAQLTAKVGEVVTCEGRALSLTNTMLLLLQIPGASMVGGFRQWLKTGRCVRKGQHGAMIWVPLGVRKKEEAIEEADEPETPDEPAARAERHFIAGTVFDISQTEAITEAEAPACQAVASERRLTIALDSVVFEPAVVAVDAPVVPVAPAPAPIAPISRPAWRRLAA